ncbi:hypothetical protein HK096_003480 [Nowakowskiella sp. JEL0078]|nr:hypothetical protein HK096_003480 [Nowakowskiella sp. JEL0078]
MWQDSIVLGDYVDICCHQILPLVASATPDGKIDLLSDDGAKTCIRKDSTPCILKWHPQKRFLAVSWSSGVVGIWCEQEQIFREGNAHSMEILVLEWSPSGNRLVSADIDGQVVVWKVDARGRLLSICQYRLKGAIRNCLFQKIFLPESKSESPPFFLGGSNGIVYYADDMGHCSEGTQVSGEVVAFEMLESTSALIVIDSDMNLYEISLSIDGKMNLEKQVKLSVGSRPNKSVFQIILVAPNTIAYASGGHIIRILDITNEESENLALPEGGTDSGFAVMWKLHVENGLENEISVSWEVGNEGKLMAVLTKSFVKLFTEQSLSWSYSGDITAIQVGPTKLTIIAKTYIDISTSIRIRGISLSTGYIVVWNGQLAEVYEYNPGPNPG